MRAEAAAKDSYGLLLALLLVDYLVLSIGEIGPGAVIASSVTVGATVLLAFHTSLVRGRLFRVVQVAVAVAVAGAVVASIVGDQHGRGGSS